MPNSPIPKSFEVFGFTIEVHAGGRRVWPPSFKKFISSSLDDGTLKVEDVMKRCNVSQSLVYKWRADIAKHPDMADIATNTSAFSEILIEADDLETTKRADLIRLRGRASEIQLPADYPVEDLITIIMALEGKASNRALR